MTDDTDWRPGAGADALRARAQLLSGLRGFFAQRDVLEVETPLLCAAAGTDPALQPIAAEAAGMLQTSPEFAMKRLLAAGSGPIYQVCKAFRADESGRRHNPEFSILEWYRPGFAQAQLMAEVADLVRLLLGRADLAEEQISYADLFRSKLGVDALGATPEVLQAVAIQQEINGAAELALDRDGWLDLLLSHCIEADLGKARLTFVTDYPLSQAALAKANDDGLTAARFELYHQGIELANGFEELTDAEQQRARFIEDNKTRRSRGQRELPVDERFLGALAHGLPACSGVALGLDRVLMLRLGLGDIDQVLSFSSRRV